MANGDVILVVYTCTVEKENDKDPVLMDLVIKINPYLSIIMKVKESSDLRRNIIVFAALASKALMFLCFISFLEFLITFHLLNLLRYVIISILNVVK